jgi:hypothetical protein
MTFKVVTAIINFYIPTTIMTFLYVRIFLAIKQRSRDIVRFGAYTASGITQTSRGRSKKTTNAVPTKKATAIIKSSVSGQTFSQPQGGGGEAVINNGGRQNAVQLEKELENDEKKRLEFHRLAVVAIPMELKSQQQPKQPVAIYQLNQRKSLQQLGKLLYWRLRTTSTV